MVVMVMITTVTGCWCRRRAANRVGHWNTALCGHASPPSPSPTPSPARPPLHSSAHLLPGEAVRHLLAHAPKLLHSSSPCLALLLQLRGQGLNAGVCLHLCHLSPLKRGPCCFTGSLQLQAKRISLLPNREGKGAGRKAGQRRHNHPHARMAERQAASGVHSARRLGDLQHTIALEQSNAWNCGIGETHPDAGECVCVGGGHGNPAPTQKSRTWTNASFKLPRSNTKAWAASRSARVRRRLAMRPWPCVARSSPRCTWCSNTARGTHWHTKQHGVVGWGGGGGWVQTHTGRWWVGEGVSAGYGRTHPPPTGHKRVPQGHRQVCTIAIHIDARRWSARAHTHTWLPSSADRTGTPPADAPGPTPATAPPPATPRPCSCRAGVATVPRSGQSTAEMVRGRATATGLGSASTGSDRRKPPRTTARGEPHTLLLLSAAPHVRTHPRTTEIAPSTHTITCKKTHT